MINRSSYSENKKTPLGLMVILVESRADDGVGPSLHHPNHPHPRVCFH